MCGRGTTKEKQLPNLSMICKIILIRRASCPNYGNYPGACKYREQLPISTFHQTLEIKGQIRIVKHRGIRQIDRKSYDRHPQNPGQRSKERDPTNERVPIPPDR